MRYIIALLFVLVGASAFAQEDKLPSNKMPDSIAKKMQQKGLVKKTKKKDDAEEVAITDYKIITYAKDTIVLDTSLTIQKEYKYNYLRRDDFELMPFSNVGQPYNKLGVDLEVNQLLPHMGAMAKNFNYKEFYEVDYYNVATPMTELMFKTTFEQGQLLDALLTFNMSRNLNMSIAYKGFRSLGKYNNDQAESGNFVTTGNYQSKSGRYDARWHIAAQDVTTEENGGLLEKELQFESGESEFKDRSRLDLLFSTQNTGENRILGKRYFLDHAYYISKKKTDSGSVKRTSLAIGHQFNYETKYYKYNQTAVEDVFGNAFVSPVEDQQRLKTMQNQVNASFYNKTLGQLKGRLDVINYNYYSNSILVTETGDIIDRLKGTEFLFGADYEKIIGGFQIKGSGTQSISGNLTGTLLDASAGYKINDKNEFSFAIHSSSRMPNFNYLLYQSDYENYNWDNADDFDKVSVNSFQFNLNSVFWGNLSAKYTTTKNYTYFTSDASAENIEAGLEQAYISPQQEGNAVNYIKVKYNKEFRLGAFALNNTLMYQNVSQTNQVLNVPEFVTRNTLYFSSDVFKKAMYIQTGITFKYFTAYNMDAYNPVLGEFYVQNNESLGGYPLLDFFINARVRQTRIYLKAEHFNSSFTGYNFYSAPNYPYRDFVIRFGLVWNFFK